MDWELTLDLRERLILYDFVKSDVHLIRVMCNLAIPHPNPRSHMTQKLISQGHIYSASDKSRFHHKAKVTPIMTLIALLCWACTVELKGGLQSDVVHLG